MAQRPYLYPKKDLKASYSAESIDQIVKQTIIKDSKMMKNCYLTGEGTLCLQCGEILLDRGFRLYGLLSGDKVNQAWADKKGLPHIHPSGDVDAFLERRPFDYLFCINDEIPLPESALSYPNQYAIGFQDSLLPKYAGWHATSWALMAEEKVHGVTWHTLKEPSETGDILIQQTIEIEEGETALSLNAKCYEAAIESFSNLLKDLSNNRVVQRGQDLREHIYFSKTKRPPAGCLIDWDQDAQNINAFVRALDFGPYPNHFGVPKVIIKNGLYVIPKCHIDELSSDAPPGTIVKTSESAITVSTKSRDVAFPQVFTPEGKAVTALELAEKHHLREGDVLPCQDPESTLGLTQYLETLSDCEAFWVDRLSTLNPYVLPLAKGIESGDHLHEYGLIQVEVPDLFIKNYSSRSSSIGLCHLLIAAFAVFLQRIGDSSDFHIGFRDKAENSIDLIFEAFFPRYIPLRVHDNHSRRFEDVCETIHRQIGTLAKKGTYARDIVFRYPALKTKRNLGSPDLFKVLVENISSTDNGDVPLKGDLIFTIEEKKSNFQWHYSKLTCNKGEICALHDCFLNFLNEIARSRDKWLSEIPLLSANERHRVLITFNDTRRQNPSLDGLCDLFDKEAVANPDKLAVLFENQRISYGELRKRSNLIGNHLQSLGIGPDVRVGIFMNRSLEMIAAVIGIMKAGGCYVPMDPDYPEKRLSFMMDDSKARVLLTGSLRKQLPRTHAKIICLDKEWNEMEGRDTVPPASEATEANLGYIIYTSGSTGTPKGVAMVRKSLTNLILWQNSISTPGTFSTLQYASLSFDVSFQEIFSTLCAGGALVLVNDGIRRDPDRLLRYIVETKIERMFLPFAGLQQLAEAGYQKGISKCHLRRVITAGESLRITPEIKRFFQQLGDCRLHNQYGPTETHVVTEHILPGQIEDWPTLPSIGRPISNTQIYLLDSNRQSIPIGIPGEIYIGGGCLARGYLERPELTTEKFISNPFDDSPNARLYKTGDQARYREDGKIEFLGRNDDQVKIRGYRIETGEIENVLSHESSVKENAVTARELVPGYKELIAYVVRRHKDCSANELRRFLRERLPDFMVPQHFVFLESLPVTPSGKLDRAALPELGDLRKTIETPYVAPKNRYEKLITETWLDVLPVDKIGISDSFFDLGGNSLLLARLQAKLSKSLGRHIPIVDLFRFPTTGSLARHLSSAEQRTLSAKTRPIPVKRKVHLKNGQIAIVGMAGRFPGAGSVDELWQNLCRGIESISFMADEDLEIAPPDAVLSDKISNFVKARGILENCDYFDASFFGYNPREAELMDPQHRIFLECASEALENAGYNPEVYPGSIGVYGGLSLNTYLIFNVLNDRNGAEEFARAYQTGAYETMTGNDKDYLTTRVSYKLHLNGPSITIQTACSSSLVAVCEACKALRQGDCEMALAGGVSISFPQKRGYQFIEGGLASADGHCRAFDADATGTVFGSGAGIVALKRLDRALSDGDTIHAVIKGTGLNNDGALKVGYMAPGVDGQADAIIMAHADAGVTADSITYVETHGTGTPLGDPIEIEALTKAFRASTHSRNFCAIGSLKTNIGHLEAASGVSGLIKTVLSLGHKKLPPSLHFQRPNPEINFSETPFFVNTELHDWDTEKKPLRAGVSSFGVGGTNAHVVLEEAPEIKPSDPSRPFQLILLSAKTMSALDTAGRNLITFLRKHRETRISDLCYTLQLGRRHFAFRSFAICQDQGDISNLLNTVDKNWVKRKDATISTPPVVFMFPGQGSQHANMGKDLYDNEPVFRNDVDQCAEILSPILDLDLRELLYPNEEERDNAARKLEETVITQPALFVIEYALAKQWMRWGVFPEAMIGHSVGEYVAACLAGVFSLEEALQVMATRALLMNEQPGGAMLAVGLGEKDIRFQLDSGLSLAASNSPRNTIISGSYEAIGLLAQKLSAQGIVTRELHTSHPFHSEMIAPVQDPFVETMKKISLSPPEIPFISGNTGTWITREEATDPAYWGRQLCQPIRFSEGILELNKEPERILLEVGPSKTLSTLTLQHSKIQKDQTVLASLKHAQEKQNDLSCMLYALGQLWLAGVEIDWKGFYAHENRHHIPLPTYPYEKRRFWIEPPKPESPLKQTAKEDRSFKTQELLPNAPEEFVPSSASETTTTPTETPLPKDKESSREEPILFSLQRELHELSGIPTEDIDVSSTFLEMGFDSLFLTQVSLAFQNKFGAKVTLRQLLGDYPTLELLSQYLEEHLPNEYAEKDVSSVPLSDFDSESPPASPSVEGDLGPFGPEKTSSRQDAGPKEKPSFRRHGPYAPIRKELRDDLTARQREIINDLIKRYVARTQKSKEITRLHRPHFADPRAVAGFRSAWKEMTYPIVTAGSSGSKVWDVDGNEYIDITMGFGIYLFGHSPPFVTKAVQKQLKKGIEIGPQSPLAGEVASLVCEFTGMDRATFCNTGSEAVLGAVRAARTVTGKNRIVLFEGDYHGINDEVLIRKGSISGPPRSFPIAPGIPPEMVKNVFVLDYGTDESLEFIESHAQDLGAVLVEPVQSRRPDLQPRDFLHKVREVTRKSGTALIFDEVITGFRSHPGGAQALFGVRADLATYGKVIGGGMPIGAIAGKSLFMDAFDGGMWHYGDDSFPEAGVTFFAGTFVRHPLAMAAAHTVLDYLKQNSPELQLKLNERTEQFADVLNTYFERERVDLRMASFSSVCYLKDNSGSKYSALLYYYLREKGLHVWEGRPIFLSTAHSEGDIERIVLAFKESVREMLRAGFLSRTSEPLRHPDSPGIEEIAGKEEKNRVHLTEAQKEIWLASQFSETASCSFNESCTLELRGSFNLDAMEKAFKALTTRHEALRTTFSQDGEFQYVAPFMDVELPVQDLSGLEDEERKKAIDDLIYEDVRRPFDLLNGPLLRVLCVKVEEDYHLLIIAAHHIVCDGWSYDVMVQDLSRLYSLACEDKIDKADRPMQLSEYAQWEEERKGEPVSRASKDYWLNVFSDSVPVVELPSDKRRPSVKSYLGAREVSPIDPKVYGEIKKVGTRNGSTLFATLLACYAVFLNRMTGQDNLAIGIPSAGQAVVGSHDLVGHCTNLLPLLIHVDREMPFTQFLTHIKKIVLDAYEHQDTTFGSLLEGLNIKRDPSRTPLVSVIFNVDPAIRGMTFGGLEVEYAANRRSAFQFDLGFNMVASSDELVNECDYTTDLFHTETIQRWMSHFETLLKGVVQNPEQPVSMIPLLTETERNRLLTRWKDGSVRYSPGRNIHELFEERASRFPERVALVIPPEGPSGSISPDEKGRKMTYAELNDRANQLAHYLKRSGMEHGAIIGLYFDRNFDMIVGILGVLKAGGAYLPMDLSYPEDRLSFMLRDARVSWILTMENLTSKLPTVDARLVCLDRESQALAMESRENPESDTSPDSLAYVIFTSGSTGKPKGVLVTHHNVVRLFQATDPWFGFNENDVWTLFHSYAFDFSVWEIWGALLFGGRLVLVPYLTSRSPELFYNLLVKEKITVLNQTPSAFRQLSTAEETLDSAEDLSLRLVIFGGEKLDLHSLAPWFERHGDENPLLVNMYGITETTVHVTYRPLKKIDLKEAPGSVIGIPIPDLQLYVLDKDLNPQPIGVPGELFAGGDGVSLGYLNRDELTAEKFLKDPFSDEPEARLYRSGDLARFLADGDIEYLGRMDDQVQLRGFRIELGEISSVLSNHPMVRESIVSAREHRIGDMQLVAYLIPAEKGTDSGKNEVGRKGSAAPLVDEFVPDLRSFLREILPDYMVPSAFVVLDSFPLTSNGKIDYGALPLPSSERMKTSEAYMAPRDEWEKQIVKIWESTLGVHPISIRDNFFDLGGHSLLAVRVILQMEKIYAQRLPLATLFLAPTVERLAGILRKKDWTPSFSSLVPIRPNGAKPPLFLIHSHGGNVLEYYPLANLLGGDQPVYALQAQGLDGNIPEDYSIEAIASHYIEEIKTIQIKGPYSVAGFCFGGLVAMEVAQQLKGKGEEIDFLGMIQTLRPGYSRMHSHVNLLHRMIYRTGYRIGLENSNLSGLSMKAKTRQVYERIIRIKDIAMAKIEMKAGRLLSMMGKRRGKHSMAYILEAISIANDKAYADYVPKPYDGSVALFPAANQRKGIPDDPSLGWGDLIKGNLSIRTIPGYQQNILKEPNVRVLTEELKKYL